MHISLIKSKCLISQTGLFDFGTFNSAVSFAKFYNQLFTPSRRHQGTFNWYQSLISLLGLTACRKDDIASLHHHVFGGGTTFRLN
jgi:hypothetical protein